jgi:hypothetical protein
LLSQVASGQQIPSVGNRLSKPVQASHVDPDMSIPILTGAGNAL